MDEPRDPRRFDISTFDLEIVLNSGVTLFFHNDQLHSVTFSPPQDTDHVPPGNSGEEQRN